MPLHNLCTIIVQAGSAAPCGADHAGDSDKLPATTTSERRFGAPGLVRSDASARNPANPTRHPGFGCSYLRDRQGNLRVTAIR